MNLHEELRKLLGNTEPIRGFKVMEWLRGVRDERYRLYGSNPKEYFRRLGISYEEVKKQGVKGKVRNLKIATNLEKLPRWAMS